ncbi:RNase A-like domain-containing protein [Cupriavidus campinensis]
MVQEDDAEGVRVLMSAQQLAAVLEQGAINLSGQGGHTLREHVGHTETQLRERLLQEPRLRASSSFPDIRTAELAISRVLHAHRRQVKTWEAGFGPIRLREEIDWGISHDAFLSRIRNLLTEGT